MGFYAGAYQAAYGDSAGTPYPLGITEEGFELEFTQFTENIRGDNLGDIVQEQLDRGHEVFLTLIGLEFDKLRSARMLAANAASSILWPPTADASVNYGDVGTIPRLRGASAAINTLIIRPLYLSTLTANYPKVVAKRAFLAENYPIRQIFNSRLRKVPLRFRLLPYERTTGIPAFFELTESGSNT